MFGFHNADYEIMQSHAYFLRAKLMIKIPHSEKIMQRYLKCVRVCIRLSLQYSIVKDSSANLGVNFKIVQIRPTVKAVCTKISKNFFLHICQYFDISERK